MLRSKKAAEQRCLTDMMVMGRRIIVKTVMESCKDACSNSNGARDVVKVDSLHGTVQKSLKTEKRGVQIFTGHP